MELLKNFPEAEVVKMKTGSYTGDGNDDRSIDIGIDLASMSFKWLVISGEDGGWSIHKFGHETGDISDSFYDHAQTANQIQAWTATGFQVGTHARVNSAFGTIYNYVVFYQP